LAKNVLLCNLTDIKFGGILNCCLLTKCQATPDNNFSICVAHHKFHSCCCCCVVAALFFFFFFFFFSSSSSSVLRSYPGLGFFYCKYSYNPINTDSKTSWMTDKATATYRTYHKKMLYGRGTRAAMTASEPERQWMKLTIFACLSPASAGRSRTLKYGHRYSKYSRLEWDSNPPSQSVT
jgi:hypothetical protein